MGGGGRLVPLAGGEGLSGNLGAGCASPRRSLEQGQRRGQGDAAVSRQSWQGAGAQNQAVVVGAASASPLSPARVKTRRGSPPDSVPGRWGSQTLPLSTPRGKT